MSRSEWISKCARVVLSSYRRDDFADPDGYLVQLGMVLERYTDGIIRDATNPITGIQRTCKWPPSVAEFVEFCDELHRRATFSSRWETQSAKQLKERALFEADAKQETPEKRREVVERILGELGAAGFSAFQKKHVVENAEELKRKYNVSDAQWEALPPTNAESNWKQVGDVNKG